MLDMEKGEALDLTLWRTRLHGLQNEWNTVSCTDSRYLYDISIDLRTTV
jgi:hypothetical protein